MAQDDLKLDELSQSEAGGGELAQTPDSSQSLIEDAVRTAVDLAPVFDVPVNISAVLGKSHIDVNSLLKLTSGSVLELDRKVGEAIDIYVNNRLVARGEVVVVEDRLGVTMTEIIKDGDAA
ncbi:flagellar motor switch protein FliN [Alkalicaulis satelles]|uniref:Flagellar motor switch protein FliN n=1 Tax=Alkalicaulis satelles TaxID=2609175 RepID=A0A5M6ZBQ2_9PROT|nr:flagellar motor switch protein FliN [Alkalicaulis satelles]KAA5802176.1 flagellar motor switch protein FliN [Alkalicaulis satelles]